MDDSASIVGQLARLLDDVVPGAEIYGAPDTQTARKLLADHRPAIVFLNVLFAGGARGNQLFSSIARCDWSPIVIALSALPREHPEVNLMFGLGAFDYMQKPLRRGTLVELLREIEIETGEAAAGTMEIPLRGPTPVFGVRQAAEQI